MKFIADNYFVIIAIAVFLLLALIGYLIDSEKNKKINNEDINKEEINPEVTEVVEQLDSDETKQNDSTNAIPLVDEEGK